MSRRRPAQMPIVGRHRGACNGEIKALASGALYCARCRQQPVPADQIIGRAELAERSRASLTLDPRDREYLAGLIANVIRYS